MFNYDLFQWIAIFISYCFLGWCAECVFVFIAHKKLVNRGTLKGPFIPIYGFGAIIVLLATFPVRENVFLTILFGIFGATVFEYVIGFIFDRLFHVRYWDYTNTPFNLNGYICLGCSLLWGLYSVLTVFLIHIPLETLILHIPSFILYICDTAFILYFICDVHFSVLKPILNNIRKRKLDIQEL